MLVALKHPDQRLVGGLPGSEDGAVIDGRPDQRMAKLQLGTGDHDQTSLLGRPQRFGSAPKGLAGGEDGGQLTGVLGSGHQQQGLGGLRQPPHPLQERLA
jgi:hypothetical protein